MLHFTIRDVLWLTVVVVMAGCWFLDRHQVKISAWQQSRATYDSHAIDVGKAHLELYQAKQQAMIAGQERERAEEEVREKQLQIEQLLAAPSPSSKGTEK